MLSNSRGGRGGENSDYFSNFCARETLPYSCCCVDKLLRVEKAKGSEGIEKAKGSEKLARNRAVHRLKKSVATIDCSKELSTLELMTDLELWKAQASAVDFSEAEDDSDDWELELEAEEEVVTEDE